MSTKGWVIWAVAMFTLIGALGVVGSLLAAAYDRDVSGQHAANAEVGQKCVMVLDECSRALKECIDVLQTAAVK